MPTLRSKILIPRHLLTNALLLLAACSSSPQQRARDASASSASKEVAVQVDLNEFPSLNGPIEDALHAAVGVVVGMRKIEDACGSYVDLRMIPEMWLGGREVSEPRDGEDSVEFRALMLNKPGAAKCADVLPKILDIKRIAIGDRIVVAVGRSSMDMRDAPVWKWQPRVIAIASIVSLPKLAKALPAARYDDESEQFLAAPRTPPIGTPHSRVFLGNATRFEIRGEEVFDRGQGIVWQKAMAPKPLSFEEAGFYCESLRLAGHSDWRLPTASEMHGMLAPGKPAPAVVDESVFSAPKESLFWTRTDDDGPWIADIDDGVIISTHYDDPSPYGNYYTRCVRSVATRVEEVVDRFIKKGEEIVDSASGLSWYLPPQGAMMKHSAARQFCEDGKFATHDDWHLPSVHETFALMSGCPDILGEWEGEGRDVWTALVDPGAKVGSTFGICNLYRSVPLAAVFEEEGVDKNDPLARVACVRESMNAQVPKAPLSCPSGTQSKRHELIEQCEDNGVPHGPFRSYYPSGDVFEVGSFDRGIRSGPFEMHHEVGGIYLRGQWKSASADGDFIATHPTGRVIAKTSFAAGSPSGRWEFFDRNERLIEYMQMKEGVSGPGLIVRYDDKGTKILECPTLRGWQHGIEQFFDDETGKVLSETTYVEGWIEGPSKRYSSNGVTDEGSYHRSLRDGVWIGKDKDGKLVYRQEFREGKLDGDWETFGQSSNEPAKRRFRAGVQVGKWQRRNDKGDLVEQGDLDEEGTGVVTWYSPNGNLEREEHFLKGKRHGLSAEYFGPNRARRKVDYKEGQIESSAEWYENGKLAERVSYSNGMKNGLAERYGEDGRLRWRGQYVDGLRQGKWEIVLLTGRHVDVVFDKGRAVSLGGS